MKRALFWSLTLALFAVSMASASNELLESLQPQQKLHGFTTLNVYENSAGKAMGARFISDKHGFIIDLMQIQSVPQAFYWIKTVPTSSKGEPHACEHLLLGKGNRGRYVAVLEDMSLGNSSAYTMQLQTCFHFNTTSGPESFYELFEAKMQAFLHPDFTDEEIRREVCHLGVTDDPQTGRMMIEEKGTVYTEMVSSFEKPWYHTWGALGKLVYGEEHPLTYNSGGNPDVMRTMVPQDMWTFHHDSYHLANMGAIVSIPDAITVDDFLTRMGQILDRCQTGEDHSDLPGIGNFQLPPAAAAPIGTRKMVGYPSDKADDQGYLIYQWPSGLKLDRQNLFMLELFSQAFAGGPTTNLYDMFINSQTRKIDIGGNYVYAGYDDDLGISIYMGLIGVNRSDVTEKMVDSVAALIQSELKRVSQFADGSTELREFNSRVRSQMAQSRKQYDDYLNSPPMFGFRSGPAGGWMALLRDLEREEGFRKSLTRSPRFAQADSLLSLNRNIWRDLINSWQLLTVRPYEVGAAPDTSMLTKSAQAKAERIASYIAKFEKQYGVADEQQAIAKYRQEFDAKTAELEAIQAKQELPKFVDNPPMTHDDQLKYEIINLDGGVPLVASTFENMTSSTLGLALRLDVVPESLMVYVPLIPSAMTDIGVIKDGVAVPYDTMRIRLQNEVLGLRASFDHGYQTERTEVVLTGDGSKLDELHNVIKWMDAALYSPYLSVENLPRIQDVIDQSLSDMRNRMKGSEESWVQYPASGYRFQTNPLIMATDCFLTQTHLMQRLRWRLTDPGDAASQEEIANLFDVLADMGQSRSRQDLIDILTRLEKVDQVVDDSLVERLSPPAKTLSATTKKNVARIARELLATLNDIPDANLAADWVYLCHETKEDMLVPPQKALAELASVLERVRHADNARLYLVSNTNDRQATLGEIKALVAKLNDSPSARQAYAKRERVIERMRSRHPDVGRPVYVGLVDEGTRNGCLIFSSKHAAPYDTSQGAVVDCLAGKLFSGGGAHGFFMRTWAAGLAYSNGYTYNQASGRVSYYAERCPDVAQTMQFVVNILKDAGEDTTLGDYAVAQVFGFSRSPDRYESRGEAMAADLADAVTPDKVRAFRQQILNFKKDHRDFYQIARDHMQQAYGPVLIGYGAPLANSPDGNFFLIGPEPQFESLERYIATAESPQPIYRLYPRDFWLL